MEEEIDLIEYINVIWKYKAIISLIIISSTATTLLISYVLPSTFCSSAIIASRSREEVGLGSVWELGRFTPLRQILGESHSLEKLKVILESRILVKGVVEKENLLPILYSKYWDKENSRWRINEPPSYLDAWSLFKKRLKVRMKKGGTMQVSFEANSPHLAKKILEGCLRELSEILRDGVIREAVQNQRFLKEQIKKTPDALLREKLYHLLASEVERETLARAQRYYGFTVLDPPLLPKRPSGPKRLLMVCISFTMSAFAGVFLAFFLNYLSSRKGRA